MKNLNSVAGLLLGLLISFSVQAQSLSFENAVKNSKVSVQIRTLEFVDRLNQATTVPTYLQHGQSLASDRQLNPLESYCAFAIGSAVAEQLVLYPIDANSVRMVGIYGANVTQFKMGDFITVACLKARPQSERLSIFDLKEIFGDVLTINIKN